jgi:hypothetical protein
VVAKERTRGFHIVQRPGRNVEAAREGFPRPRALNRPGAALPRQIDGAGHQGKQGRRNAISAYVIRSREKSRTFICRADFSGFDGFALAVHGTPPPIKDLHIGCASSILSRDHIARMLIMRKLRARMRRLHAH